MLLLSRRSCCSLRPPPSPYSFDTPSTWIYMCARTLLMKNCFIQCIKNKGTVVCAFFRPARTRTHIFSLSSKWQILHEKSRHFNTNRNEIYTNTLSASHTFAFGKLSNKKTLENASTESFFFSFNPDSKNALTLISVNVFVSLSSRK